MSKSTLLCLTAAYIGCLVIAPRFAEVIWLIPIILVARVLLLAPLFLCSGQRGDDSNVDKAQDYEVGARNTQVLIAAFALLPTVWQVSKLVQDHSSLKGIIEALFSHPAVSALGYDLVLCLVSLILWISIDTTAPSVQIDRKMQ